jgi:FKBP-type peptidyl-prolyl cis-trans isomerase
MKRTVCLALVLLAGCSGEKTTPSGVRYIDVVEGSGPAAQRGDYLQVEYVGTLKDGPEFDRSSRGPMAIWLGEPTLIRGWNDGLVGIKEGGKRRLWVPPALAYGAEGRPPKIPPNAELVFDVEVIRLVPRKKSSQ